MGGVNYQYDKPASINDQAFTIYREYFRKFGLGVKTEIDLPNESSGYQGSKKDAGLLMNLAIGQYDTYSNIQINQYISTIANGGKRLKLHLLKEVKDKYTFEPVILNTINIDDLYLNRLKKAFKLVMTAGTGRGYVNLSLNPSGKTGTSETFVDSDGDLKYETETISTSFVTYFPSDNPSIAIAITSPNISYQNKQTSYIYPFNKMVISRLTNYFLN